MIGITGSEPEDRHQHERHQRAGAVAGDAADTEANIATPAISRS